MSPVLCCASISVFLLTACSPGEEPGAARRAGVAVPAGTSYSGEFVLRGEAAFLAGGSATIAIVAPGEDAPVLARSWDLGDPAWREGDDSVRLYFALDARDAWPGASGQIAADMDLVARFDPDGNPATDERGVARSRMSVRTGARELEVELAIDPQVAVHAAPTGG